VRSHAAAGIKQRPRRRARAVAACAAIGLAGGVLPQVATGAAGSASGSDDTVLAYGKAGFYGSTSGLDLSEPVVGMAATPDGRGYWLVARDGGIFSFGSARFYGSTGGIRLNEPVVGMAAAPDGRGYWLVARDGGIFSFGSAGFHGSTGGIRLDRPVVGMASSPTGRGYWMAGDDGGIFAFGDARFRGSAFGNLALDRRVVQITGLHAGQGYRLLSLPIPPDVVLLGAGATGPGVVDLQNRLTSLGYWLGSANGAYGLLTEQAVTAFQKVEGLPRTGRVDVGTQAKMRDADRPLPHTITGYAIEVDKARQVILVARNGRTEWIINTSTGTERSYVFEGHTYLADTPVGSFHVFSEVDGYRDGPLGRLYRPKYFHPDGIAFHGYSSVPPYPASHGCVRMTNAAIDWVWAANIIPMGAAVLVY